MGQRAFGRRPGPKKPVGYFGEESAFPAIFKML